MADVGGTKKVTGNKIATPFTDPSPGIAPMNRPARQPAKIMNRFKGSKACSNPSPSNETISSIGISRPISTSNIPNGNYLSRETHLQKPAIPLVDIWLVATQKESK